MINTTSISIALAKNNVEWSDNYDNVILFNHDIEILDYLGLSDSDFIQYNFPLFSSTKPRDIVIDLKNENKNVYDIVNSNYLVARLITSDGKTKYYYYFVNSATQSTQTTFVFTLTLDIFTTYKLNVDFSIKNVLTARKHCDRFKKLSSTGNPILAFKYDSDSEVMIEDDIEQIEYPKMLRNTYRPFNLYQTSQPKLWLYLYVSLPKGVSSDNDRTDGQVIVGFDNTKNEYKVHVNYSYKFDTKEVENNYAVLVAPLKTIYVDNVPFKPQNATENDNWQGFYGFEWNASNLIKTLGSGLSSDNGRYIGSFQVFGANVGEMPPLNLPISQGRIDYNDLQETFIGNNQLIFTYVELATSDRTSDNTFAPFLVYSNIKESGGITHKADFQIYSITGKFQITPTATRSDRNPDYEPKLYKSSFRSVRLKSNLSEVYKDFPLLNILSLNTSTLDATTQIYYAEIPAIDGINCFATIIDKNNGCIYTRYNDDNFLGNIYKNNFSFAITSDQYTNYLLNNKNAYLTGIVMPTAQRIVQTATSLLGNKNLTESFKNLAGGIFDTVGNVVNFHAKIDNLQNAPDSLKYIQSNSLEALLRPQVEFAPYIEYWEAYSIYLDLAYQYYYAMGYKVNKFTSSNEWNNRYYFNFVQTSESCESKIISEIPLSLEIKRLISNALLKGITFWNYTEQFAYLDYSMENWENDLL